MKLINKLYPLLVIAMLMVGCKKDSETFIATSEDQHSAAIIGVVTDVNRSPISNAVVQYDGHSTVTDQHGYFSFENAQVGSEHNFLTVSQTGYFTASKTFRTNTSGDITLETQLVKSDFAHSFMSSTPSTVTEGGVKLVFPANSIVRDNDKSPYSGEVLVAVAPINPTTYSGVSQMPGDLTSINANNELETVKSFGMVYVNLQSPSGEKLQVKPGEYVEMTSDIPADMLADAPNEVTLRSFNNTKGLWEEEGTATRNGNQYVGQVGHFSCWNYDLSDPSVAVWGRVVDENGKPISHAHLIFSTTPDGWGSNGFVSSHGTFSARVPKGKTLYASVLASVEGGCGFERFSLGKVGPYSASTIVGDLMFKPPTTSSKSALKITGSFTDCNGNLIKKGYAQVHGQYYTITSGKLNATQWHCNLPQSVGVYAVNLSDLQTIEYTASVTSNKLDLGTVKVCQTESDYVQVKSTGLNYDELFLKDVSISFPVDSNFLSATSTIPEAQGFMFIRFDNGGADEGTFNLIGGSVNLSSYNNDPAYPKTYTRDVSGSITITKNQTSKVYEGTYTVTAKTSDLSDTKTFTGKFRRKY